jgi:hypothetical protein
MGGTCDAEIQWVSAEVWTGRGEERKKVWKKIPVDILDQEGDELDPELDEFDADTMIRHHTTCPDTELFRGGAKRPRG